MLVLSRKENQQIVFSNLGISVEILRIAGKTTRIGVKAPREIQVLRGELSAFKDEGPGSTQSSRNLRHELRNRLHTANLTLHLLQKQLEAGRLEDAEQTLQKALDSLEQLDKAVSEGLAPAATESKAPACRALVVEDNANERELLAGYLRLCGYTVDTAEDGLAAMKYLADHELPDVVLLDMQMPRMDGPATVAAIRSNPEHRDIRLFAVSGMQLDELSDAVAADDLDGWFCKPLQPAEFARRISQPTLAELPTN